MNPWIFERLTIAFAAIAFCFRLIDEFIFAIIYCIAKHIHLYLLLNLVFVYQKRIAERIRRKFE